MGCGVMPEEPYEDYTFRLPPGGKLFVYTDGVVEAHNVKDELLGVEETIKELNRSVGETPEETVKRVLKRVNDFAGECEQFDDITMLSLWYKGENV